ncbi:MAG: hypothetical protein WEF86_01060 [Gemmatimonadota bacterium]
MRTVERRIFRVPAAAACLFLLPGAGAAHAQDLPAASEIVARYQKAVGGVDALARHSVVHTTGKFLLPAAGLTADFEAWSARPNRTVMRVLVPGFGDIRSGFDGTVAWSLNPMEGPRIMEDAERLQAADEADFDSQLRLEGSIDSMTTVGRTTLAGVECLKVRVQWKSGRESFDCYSPETGLMVGSIAMHVSNMGSAEAITLYDAYREFGGVVMPTRVTVQVMGTEQVITITDVSFDAAPDSVFELPAEIKPLVR